MNKVFLTGRLVRDIERKESAGGKAMASFTVAVDRGYSSTSGEKETDFINCVAWGKTAEIAANLVGKGNRVLVEGRLQVRPWTDKNGNKNITTEVVVDRTEAIDYKQKKEAGAMSAFQDDVPF